MGRPKKSQGRNEGADLPAVVTVEDDTPAEVTDAWASWPTDSRIELFRRGDTSKELEYCGVLGIEEFTMDKVRELYGGGDYTAKAKWRKNGKMAYGSQYSFRIAGPAAWSRGGGPVPGGGTRETMSDTLLAAMIQNLKPPAPSGPQAGTLVALAGILVPVGVELIKAMGGRKDPTELAVEIAKLTRPANGAPQPISEMLAVFREGMEIGRKAVGAGGGDETDTTALVGRGLEIVDKFAEGYVANARHPKQLTDGAPPAAAAPVQARPWVVAVYPHRSHIKGLAGFWSPSSAATALAGQFPEDALFDLLDDYEGGTPDEFAQRAGPLLELDPKQWPWLLAVVAELQAIANAEAGDDDEEEPPPAAGAAAPPAGG